MSTTTPNYSLIKPGVNDPTDQDLWGGYLNSNFDTIDSQLKEASNFVTSAKTANYTILTTENKRLFLCDATSGSFTITLPAAASAGSGFTVSVQKVDSSANTVTIDADGSETINGAANYVLSSQYQIATLVCTGTAWVLLANTAVAASETTAGVIEIATEAEVEAGSSNVLAVTPGRLKGAIGFSKMYESAELSYTANSTVTDTHGLGARPFITFTFLRCKTSELGFSVGDEIMLNTHLEPGGGTAADDYGITTFHNSTTLNAVIGQEGLNLIVASTRGRAIPTPANWVIVFKAMI